MKLMVIVFVLCGLVAGYSGIRWLRSAGHLGLVSSSRIVKKKAAAKVKAAKSVRLIGVVGAVGLLSDSRYVVQGERYVEGLCVRVGRVGVEFVSDRGVRTRYKLSSSRSIWESVEHVTADSVRNGVIRNNAAG